MKPQKNNFLAVIFALLLGGSAQAALIHRYSFDTDASDSVGTAHGTLENGATITSGQVVLDGIGSSQNVPGQHVSLPGETIAINSLGDVTIEAWYTPTNNSKWARLFDFGASNGRGSDYLLYVPRNGHNAQLRAAITNNVNSDELRVDGGAHPAGETYVAVVVNGTAATPNIELFINGASMGSANLGATTLAGLSNEFAYLGRALFNDPMFAGSINEFRISNDPLSAEQISASFAAGPDMVIDFNGGNLRITAIQYVPDADPNPTVTLTWRSRSNTTYKALVSSDLSDWDFVLADMIGAAHDEIGDDGDHITVTFPLIDGLENVLDLFFRIEEEE